MKVFIMRHGEAGHLAASDAERTLTERGKEQSIAVAQACKKQAVTGFDRVLVSPYVRAQQTWQAIEEHFELADASVHTYDEITPYGDSMDVKQYLSALIDVEKLNTVLLVSHLPLVGYLTADFVAGMSAPMFPTSGLVCIEYDPVTQSGQLEWHINP
jgi:phosphohistidine phosphatase